MSTIQMALYTLFMAIAPFACAGILTWNLLRLHQHDDLDPGMLRAIDTGFRRLVIFLSGWFLLVTSGMFGLLFASAVTSPIRAVPLPLSSADPITGLGIALSALFGVGIAVASLMVMRRVVTQHEAAIAAFHLWKIR